MEAHTHTNKHITQGYTTTWESEIKPSSYVVIPNIEPRRLPKLLHHETISLEPDTHDLRRKKNISSIRPLCGSHFYHRLTLI
jgi:hypothetical protein